MNDPHESISDNLFMVGYMRCLCRDTVEPILHSPPPTKRLVVGRFRFGCDKTGGPFRPAFGEACAGAVCHAALGGGNVG